MRVAEMVHAPIAKYMSLLQLDIITQSLSITTHNCHTADKQLYMLLQTVHVATVLKVCGYTESVRHIS